ncbi:Anaphase-promoting complex subunit 8 [Ceratocystis lukuohia]|uniref:Anaphase-promoting complex subunit 8 n=1 Tax=Ceratocystis lukuohia TaxID=2019550 RepID=A0ABR4MHS3_9PEZI
MSLSYNDRVQLRAALQEAVIKCSERCLYQSAKWAAELLDSLPDPDDDPETSQADRTTFDPSPSVILSTGNKDPEEAALEAKETNKYLLAKSFFDCREYDRCAAVFLPDSLLGGIADNKKNPKSRRTKTSAASASAPASDPTNTSPSNGSTSSSSQVPLPKISQRSLFLALYAKLIGGEKRKEEDTEMVMGAQDLGNVVNKNLIVIGRYLERWFSEPDAAQRSQGWLEYLYGMVLAKDSNDQKAMEYFINSVHLFPMNWGCWLELTNIVTRSELLNEITAQLPQNIMSFIFHVHTSLELYQHSSNLLNSLEQLIIIFPTSAFLLTCTALLAYHAKDFYGAEQTFSKLLALHPHRLDSLDHYSNILYVLGMRPKLAFLAHLCSNVDRFRPESCVVIGNYYSLLSMHEKAVQYFRRALTLDRSCLSAWTLMGHEYVELKNTHAAIESYRRAVDVNRRDYRAWYGLGQTYEMLEMHAYSLWYYKRACGLRPWDGKMWMAIGTCTQKMGHYQEAIKALKRALMADAYYEMGSSPGSGDNFRVRGVPRQMDPEVLLQIALMHEQLDDIPTSKAYMELCMAQEVGGAAAAQALSSDIQGLHTGAGNHSSTSMRESLSAADDTVMSDDDPTSHLPPTSTPAIPTAPSSSTDSGHVEGTGVTAATSKARMWLARHALQTGEYVTASRLANELCEDGVEVEEAKALARDARARLEAAPAQGSSHTPTAFPALPHRSGGGGGASINGRDNSASASASASPSPMSFHATHSFASHHHHHHRSATSRRSLSAIIGLPTNRPSLDEYLDSMLHPHPADVDASTPRPTSIYAPVAPGPISVSVSPPAVSTPTPATLPFLPTQSTSANASSSSTFRYLHHLTTPPHYVVPNTIRGGGNTNNTNSQSSGDPALGRSSSPASSSPDSSRFLSDDDYDDDNRMSTSRVHGI